MGIVGNRNTVWISVSLSREEKRQLDDAVKQSGTNRNRFIRNWIATLRRN